MTQKPDSATLFAFNVGFGDCFLLRFQYPGTMRRHVLVDFGSTRQPPSRPANFLTRVAEQIKDLCGGKLDVIVATHRHKDHIYGFRTNTKGDAPGNVIASCNPTLVLQPWTEHPDADRDALASPDQSDASRSFAKSLANMNLLSQRVLQIARADGKAAGTAGAEARFDPKVRKALSFLGENNIANKSAVKNLMSMGRERRYLSFGDDPGTSAILPGVDVDVLGPPTLTQNGAIAKQRSRHKEEYWHLQAAAAGAELAAEEGRSLFPEHVAKTVPSWARWGRHRLKKMRSDMLLPVVRRLDDQMNNTSLILLFAVGDKSLLFPGDAQWENWSHALADEDVRGKLSSVDLYKVGHHGSLNATPKSLWNLLDNRGPAATTERLTSVMSTKHGVHGHSPATEVPRKTLVDALKADSHFHNTEDKRIRKNSVTFYDEVHLTFE